MRYSVLSHLLIPFRAVHIFGLALSVWNVALGHLAMEKVTPTEPQLQSSVAPWFLVTRLLPRTLDALPATSPNDK